MRITILGNFQPGEPNPWSSESHHAKTLRSMGHHVVCLQETESTGEEVLEQALQSELFVWIHTHGWATPGLDMTEVLTQLKAKGIPTITYHLDLWLGLERQRDLDEDPFYKQIDHFFATDKLMADWFNENTNVKGHYLPAGVVEDEALMLDKQQDLDVIFVGSKGYHPEWPYRPQLINWLSDTYGERFGHYSGEEEAKGLRRGLHLNQLYADAKVVVGDTLCLNFDYPYYYSDRVFETLGRGGFLIMPYIKGLDDIFEDGKHLVFYEYGDFKQLKSIIDFYLENDQAREYIRRQGHELVKNSHSYTNRWKEILNAI